jgi:hypothetical protein
MNDRTYSAACELRFVLFGDSDACAVRLVCFELLACHLTTDQASERLGSLICAD